MHGIVKHLNPAGLHKNPPYTQAVVVSGNATTIYIGGQNAVDASGNIVGKGDIREQTEKALRNLETALGAGGAEFQHVVKWNVYIVHGQSARAGLKRSKKCGANVRIHPSLPVSLSQPWHTPIFLWRLMPLLWFPRSEPPTRRSGTSCRFVIERDIDFQGGGIPHGNNRLPREPAQVLGPQIAAGQHGSQPISRQIVNLDRGQTCGRGRLQQEAERLC